MAIAMDLNEILKLSPAIPVVTIEDIRHAIPLAEALLAGGITIMEVTLRTNAAYDAIRSISRALPQMTIGAGTIVEVSQLSQVKEAGAHFAVSPGLTQELAIAAMRLDLPYLPGAMTPSDILLAKSLGITALKFFPAESAGGITTLKHYAEIFPHMQFCPTGGIDRSNMYNYLVLKNVIAVGGSWLAPKNLLSHNNWESITALAKQIFQSHN